MQDFKVVIFTLDKYSTTSELFFKVSIHYFFENQKITEKLTGEFEFNGAVGNSTRDCYKIGSSKRSVDQFFSFVFTQSPHWL